MSSARKRDTSSVRLMIDDMMTGKSNELHAHWEFICASIDEVVIQILSSVNVSFIRVLTAVSQAV